MLKNNPSRNGLCGGNFGPSVPTLFSVDDNTGDNEDPVIRRGSCTFVLKVEACADWKITMF